MKYLLFGLTLTYFITKAWLLEFQDTSFQVDNVKKFNSKINENKKQRNVEEMLNTTVLGYRLPLNLRPTNYDIHLKIFDERYDELKYYDGIVEIQFECVEKTNRLIIHITNLIIKNTTLQIKGLTDSKFKINNFDWYYVPDAQFMVAVLPLYFTVGHKYSLFIEYTGEVNTNDIGFYKSSYLDDDANKKWVLATALAPTEARRMFPSFDEPNLKARFNVKLTHHSSLASFSNMPIDKTTRLSDGLVETRFQVTPLISTYMIGVFIGDFVCKSEFAKAGIKNRVEVRVCAKRSSLSRLNFALKAGVQMIEFIESVTGVKYPLSKCDHIAIPDFLTGAMENFGVIAYREERLLKDDNSKFALSDIPIIIVMGHEIAHLWFGDLVTCDWWDSVWLNEGFADYMTFVAGHNYKPEWNIDEQFLNEMLTVMDTDAYPYSRKMSTEVNKPIEANQAFNRITYYKGESILRMANYIVGANTFNKGIKKYVQKFQYKTVKPNDLWSTLNEQARLDNIRLPVNLSTIMSTWTNQMGFPFISIKKIDANTISASQSQFFLNPLSRPIEPSPFNYTWYVPLTISIEKIGMSQMSQNANNLYKKINWLKPMKVAETIKTEPIDDENKFILANLDALGYFRVNYEIDNWNKIIKQLNTNHEAISKTNRAKLVDDAFTLSRAGLLKIEILLDLLKYLSKEKSSFVWSITLNHLTFLSNMLESTGIYSQFIQYLLDISTPVYTELGWDEMETDKYDDIALRKSIIGLVCLKNSEDCIDIARNLYSSWMNDPKENSIYDNVRGIVYCTAIKYGTEKEWKFALSMYLNETNGDHKIDLQYGMSCTREPYLIHLYLNTQLDETKVKFQDTTKGLMYASTSVYANAITWNFLKENWNKLLERYDAYLSLGIIVSELTNKFNTKSQLNDVEAFYSTIQEGTSILRLAAERVNANINWLKVNLDPIRKWLDDYTSEYTL